MPGFVQEAVNRVDSVSPFTVVFGAGVTGGNKVFLSLSLDQSISSVSGLGATWSRIVLTGADTNGTHLEVWEGDSPTTGTTVTVTAAAATFGDFAMTEWSSVGFVGTPGSTVVSAPSVTSPAQHLYAVSDIEYAVFTMGSSTITPTYTDAPSAWTTKTAQQQNNLSETFLHGYRVAAASSEDPTRNVLADGLSRPFKSASLILAAAAPPPPPPRLLVAQRAALICASNW